MGMFSTLKGLSHTYSKCSQCTATVDLLPNRFRPLLVDDHIYQHRRPGRLRQMRSRIIDWNILIIANVAIHTGFLFGIV